MVPVQYSSGRTAYFHMDCLPRTARAVAVTTSSVTVRRCDEFGAIVTERGAAHLAG